MIDIQIEPLTPQNWQSFEELFGEKGACGNCWCMYFRRSKADFVEGKFDDGNKNAMKELVWQNKPTGLIGFIEDKPIAWCALAPRADYPKLEKSRIHKPIDDKVVWTITCLFIDKRYRKQGVSIALLKKVIEFAKVQKVAILEAYPTIPTQKTLPDSFLWIGVYSSFEKAGFTIVNNKSVNRPMVRVYLY